MLPALQHFADSLPRRPYCTDDPHMGQTVRGRVDARLLLFTAWAPHPDQPREKRALNAGIFDKLP